MKIERQLEEPQFQKMIKNYLPNSLEYGSILEGYCHGYYIWQKGCKPWFGRGNPIAEIFNSSVHLFHPQYFQDMENMISEYEKRTGHEITLKYWQSPKDEPIK